MQGWNTKGKAHMELNVVMDRKGKKILQVYQQQKED